MTLAHGSIWRLVALLAPTLGGCAVADSHVAESAQKRLIGMDEVDVYTCLGVPDQHQTFGETDILTYYTSSSSSVSYQLPLVQGPSFSNGGNCHMTIRLDRQNVTRILYSGEKNATGAPDAFCAPIVRACMETLNALAREKGSGAALGRQRGSGGAQP